MPKGLEKLKHTQQQTTEQISAPATGLAAEKDALNPMLKLFGVYFLLSQPWRLSSHVKFFFFFKPEPKSENIIVKFLSQKLRHM